MSCSFFVPGIPIAQPRHKIAKGANQKFAKAYIDKEHPVHHFKAAVMMAARDAKALPLVGPIMLFVEARFPRQASKVWKNKAMPRYPHVTRPDLDNIVKAVKDALNGICWADDSQVSNLSASKVHVAWNEACGTHVSVIALDDLPRSDRDP